MTLPHAARVPGEFSFDPVLRDLGAHADRATARTTAKYTEYPSGHLRLAGGAWPWRPTLMLLATLVAAAGIGLLPAVLAGRLARRRPDRSAAFAVSAKADPAPAARGGRARRNWRSRRARDR